MNFFIQIAVIFTEIRAAESNPTNRGFEYVPKRFEELTKQGSILQEKLQKMEQNFKDKNLLSNDNSTSPASQLRRLQQSRPECSNMNHFNDKLRFRDRIPKNRRD